ncbi:MAG: sporulation initiation factor Spo0A C-terminal domain-containing protein [bacterium]
MEPMNILILEDDEKEVKKFTSCIASRDEINLISTTNSLEDALHIIKNNFIEGIVVDIELNKGLGGSGLDFLKELQNLDIDFKPILIVTTNNEADTVYNACKSLGVDMLFHKSKEDYEPTFVLNQFITLRPFIKRNTKQNIKSKLETEIERQKRISEYIEEEMNLIGLPPHLKGSKYIKEAIEYLINNQNHEENYYTAYLEEKYRIRKGSISTSMQDSINNAWRNTPEEDILEHFKANISYSKGTPLPAQFIHYYVEKIQRRI